MGIGRINKKEDRRQKSKFGGLFRAYAGHVTEINESMLTMWIIIYLGKNYKRRE